MRNAWKVRLAGFPPCRLAGAGIDEPRREARLLLAAATGLSQASLLARSEGPVGEEFRHAVAGHEQAHVRVMPHQ